MNTRRPIRPERITVDGRDWVSAEAFDDLQGKLRQRTEASHGHYFAEIRDLWRNIPETEQAQPWAKSAEAFRKHALIETGWHTTETIDFQDHQLAINSAPKIANVARRDDGYAVVVVRGTLVMCWSPVSQSYKAMGKDAFEKSKADVLNWCRQKIGFDTCPKPFRPIAF